MLNPRDTNCLDLFIENKCINAGCWRPLMPNSSTSLFPFSNRLSLCPPCHHDYRSTTEPEIHSCPLFPFHISSPDSCQTPYLPFRRCRLLYQHKRTGVSTTSMILWSLLLFSSGILPRDRTIFTSRNNPLSPPTTRQPIRITLHSIPLSFIWRRQFWSNGKEVVRSQKIMHHLAFRWPDRRHDPSPPAYSRTTSTSCS